jgi:hypothetical protein
MLVNVGLVMCLVLGVVTLAAWLVGIGVLVGVWAGELGAAGRASAGRVGAGRGAQVGAASHVGQARGANVVLGLGVAITGGATMMLVVALGLMHVHGASLFGLVGSSGFDISGLGSGNQVAPCWGGGLGLGMGGPGYGVQGDGVIVFGQAGWVRGCEVGGLGDAVRGSCGAGLVDAVLGSGAWLGGGVGGVGHAGLGGGGAHLTADLAQGLGSLDGGGVLFDVDGDVTLLGLDAHLAALHLDGLGDLGIIAHIDAGPGATWAQLADNHAVFEGQPQPVPCSCAGCPRPDAGWGWGGGWARGEARGGGRAGADGWAHHGMLNSGGLSRCGSSVLGEVFTGVLGDVGLMVGGILGDMAGWLDVGLVHGVEINAQSPGVAG